METTDETGEADESRCESVGRRLLEYLGASVECVDGSINVHFPLYLSNATYVMYKSWHSLIWLKNDLVNARSLMDNVRVSVLRDPGFKVSNPPFRYSSLDELELQLSIRGF